MSDWLELELANRLGPVAAPGELWERIEDRRRVDARAASVRTPRRHAGRPVFGAALAASLGLIACALWLAGTADPALDIRQLAASGRRANAPLDLRSPDPGQIRTWLRRQAGVDVPLRDAAGIRLEGARVWRNGGGRVGAIAFRVGGDSATLLVARAGPACSVPPHGRRGAAWRSGNQVFALACSRPEQAEAACLLCHANL